MNEKDTTELIDYLEDRLPANWRRVLEGDAEFRARLARLAQVRSELADLPDPEPPPLMALSLEPKARRSPAARSWLPMLAAAAVVICVIGVGLLSTPADDGVVEQPSLATLIAESQALERVWASDRPYRLVASPAARGIAMRITDVDGEIAALGEPVAEDIASRRVLWQRRVELMQSLIDSERARPEPPFVL